MSLNVKIETGTGLLINKLTEQGYIEQGRTGHCRIEQCQTEQNWIELDWKKKEQIKTKPGWSVKVKVQQSWMQQDGGKLELGHADFLKLTISTVILHWQRHKKRWAYFGEKHCDTLYKLPSQGQHKHRQWQSLQIEDSRHDTRWMYSVRADFPRWAGLPKFYRR